jgi:predicted TIM-barrel fold metal-dependent hydrolase
MPDPIAIVSADDHVIEPPTLWSDRLPRKYQDVGPRVEYLGTGTTRVDELGRTFDLPGEGPLAAYWRLEDTYWGLTRQVAAAGFAREEMSKAPVTFEQIRPGCWDPTERLNDMDANGVEASLCFPNYPRFAGQRFADMEDKMLALLCVQAYNDWMVDEWCGGSGGRLIPLCIVPLWDPLLAAAEVTRNRDRGVTAVCFTELPTYLGLPSIFSGQWDPFYQACDDAEAVISMHIGSGTKMFSTGPDMPENMVSVMHFVNSAASLSEYLYSDILIRYPRIKLFYAESQIGWIPYVLDKLDDAWLSQDFKRGSAASRLPSSNYWGRVYSCMFKDKVGSRLLDLIGADQVMFETDYPHSDSTWPNSPDRAAELLRGVPEHDQYKILRGNAIRLFNLSLA